MISPPPPTVSVVISAYNYGRFLREAIDSALRQTRPPHEVIVVDDGSTDETPEVAKRYEGKIHYIRTENRGVAAARNTGVAAAEGNLIALLDGDDRWVLTKLERQVESFAAAPDLGLVHAGSRIFDQNTGETLCEILPEPQTDLLSLLRWCGISLSSALIPRRVFQEVGGFDERLRNAEDWDLWIRVAARHPVQPLREVLIEYRDHGQNKSRQIERRLQCCLALLDKAQRSYATQPECLEAIRSARTRVRKVYYQKATALARDRFYRHHYFESVGWRMRSLWVYPEALKSIVNRVGLSAKSSANGESAETRPLTVALFASAYYPHVGGVEELVRQLAHSYRRKGIRAIVLTNRWPRTLPAFETHERTAVYRLAMRTPEPDLRARITYYLSHLAIRRQVLAILRRHQVDVIHVQCVSSNGLYAYHASKALGLPLVVTTQGERTMDATQIYQHSSFLNGVLRSLLDDADYISACSRDTLEDMERYYGKPFAERASVIYNGIETADFERAEPFAHPRPYILGIGRLVEQKGFDVLIEAFARANVEGCDLIIAGEGTQRAALEKLAASLGVADRVIFPGRADRPTAASLFKGALFFVLPSRQEPMGIVNLEAMAAGKAIIASRVGGVPEIVLDGETGLLVPGSDAESLASAIRRLANDDELRTRLATAGNARAQEFAWNAIAGQYVKIYEGLAAGRNGHS